MFKFFYIVEAQGEKEDVTEKVISDGKKMSENINDTETEYATIEDPLSLHRTSSNATSVISEIPNIINEENVIIAPGQIKNPVSILS